MRRLLASLAVLATLVAGSQAQAAFQPGDEVSYTAGGGARVGFVLSKAGGRDLYLVSRNGAESTQYHLPGSRLTLRSSAPDPLAGRVSKLEAELTSLRGAVDQLESRIDALEPDPPPPSTSPVVYVTPTEGAKVSGTTTIRVRAPADTEWVGAWGCGGQLLGEDTSPPPAGSYEWTVDWDTTACANGTTPVEAWAFRGPTKISASRNFNVQNVAQPPADGDGDGVPDGSDRCPTTPAGTQVDANGCPMVFPPPAGDEPAPIAGQGYTQRFADDFNTLDRSVWCPKLYWEGSPPAGSQTVANGELKLTRARSSNYANTTISTEPNCNQANPKEFVQGYFEARMRWDPVRGNGPAFWLLGSRHGLNPAYPNISPVCADQGLPRAECLAAELDVIEGFGNIQYGGTRQDDWFSGALHRNTNGHYGEPDTVRSVQVGTGAEMEQYHTYAAKWTSSQVCWYFDDRLLGCRDTFDSANQPMHMILYNWNTGWESENMPTSTTPDTLNLWVDWVRVWQRG